jgi:muramoyltetrapeptide carboxypeptidase
MRDLSGVDEFKPILEGFGFRVRIGETCRAKFGYLAGSDHLRRTELESFFSDPEVDAIVCMKGGYGCSRIIDTLNYDLIKKQPKIFMGFSDITAITFHGPVGNSSWNDYSYAHIAEVLMAGKKHRYFPGPESADKPVTYSSGTAQGVLYGGNLSVLCGLLGTPYFPDLHGALLFLEEVKEEPFRIDRMLAQMRLAGVFDQVNGIIIGKFRDCIAEEPDFAFTVDEIFKQYFSKLNKPVYAGAMIGHIRNKYTLPVGLKALMNADKGTIELLESAVV